MNSSTRMATAEATTGEDADEPGLEMGPSTRSLSNNINQASMDYENSDPGSGNLCYPETTDSGTTTTWGRPKGDNARIVKESEADGTTQQENAESEVLTLSRGELEALVQQGVQQNMLHMKEEIASQMKEEIASLHKKIDELTEAGSNSRSQAALAPPDLEQMKPLVGGSDSCMDQFQQEEPNEEDWHAPFGDSVYTLLYMCEFQSQSFLYSLFVYGIQMAAISLTLVDILNNNFPPMVDLAVTIVQAVTIFVVLAYMSDLIEAVLKLQDGFYPEVLEKHPGATYSTWMVSCLAQLAAGLLLLTASFILTMQVTTVIEAMLNLTALLFMAEIDDLGFALAKMGFITDKLQAEAMAVANFRVPKRKGRTIQRRVLYLMTLLGLCLGYAIFKNRQLSGYYLPTYVYVQFGDAYTTKYPYYSGILSSGDVWTFRHREYRDLETTDILLGYCKSEQSWTFSEGDPCNFFAKSHPIETYDVTSIPNSFWEIKDPIDRLLPFDSFSLVGRDCDPNICQGICGASGLCECPHDQFGMDCEFEDVCPKLVLDWRFEPFPSIVIKDVNQASTVQRTNIHRVSDEFTLLWNSATNELVKVYNMPVYYSNRTYPANILFFAGRRWVLTTEWDLFDLKEARKRNREDWFFLEKTIATLENNFHGYHQASYTPFYISDPVDFETPNFLPTPVGLKWFSIRKGNETVRQYEPDTAIETLLLCREKRLSCLDKPHGFCVNGVCNRNTDSCKCTDSSDNTARCEKDYKIPCDVGFGPKCNGYGDCDLSTGVCRCEPPMYGKNCEQQYKCFEKGGGCLNGGVCNMFSGECDCPNDPAISGKACERVASCSIYGCANGGFCPDDSLFFTGGRCVCRPPYHGYHCDLVNKTQEEFLCSSDSHCLNGTCDVGTGTCACNIPTSYGARCEHTYNCSKSGCLNSGTCQATTGVCECAESYSGPDCSQVKPCKLINECNFAGSCKREDGVCICNSGRAAGRLCEREPTCVDDEDCNLNGICKGTNRQYCECELGKTGQACESSNTFLFDNSYLSIFLDDEELDDPSVAMEFIHQYNEKRVGCCGFDDPDGCDLDQCEDFG